jgi:hypothetical protein
VPEPLDRPLTEARVSVRSTGVISRLAQPFVASGLVSWNLNENRFEGDESGSWLGDQLDMPLWLYVLLEAFSSRVFLSLSVQEAVALVQPSSERRQALCVLLRLGTQASDVFRALDTWIEEDAQARSSGAVQEK